MNGYFGTKCTKLTSKTLTVRMETISFKEGKFGGAKFSYETTMKVSGVSVPVSGLSTSVP